VAVVAHSQGTAIAHAALVSGPFTKEQVPLFITFGNGLKKLNLLKAGLDHKGSSFFAGLLISLATLSVVTGLVAIAMTHGDIWAWAVLLLGAPLFAGLSILPLRKKVDPLELEEGVLDETGAVWFDFYAESDPVPEGSLKFKGPTPIRQSRKISNLGSVLRDHLTYCSNPEMFVSNVAKLLAWNLTGIPLVAGTEADFLKMVERRRARRVDALAMVYFLAVVGVLLIWATFGREGLRDVGTPMLSGLSHAATASGLPGEDRLRGLVADPWAGPTASASIAALIVALLAGVWYRLAITQAWQYWGRVEAALMFKRQSSSRERGAAIWLFMLASMALLIVESLVAISGLSGVSRFLVDRANSVRAAWTGISTTISGYSGPDITSALVGTIRIILAVGIVALCAFAVAWYRRECLSSEKPFWWEVENDSPPPNLEQQDAPTAPAGATGSR
jgi:hypothetical protein